MFSVLREIAHTRKEKKRSLWPSGVADTFRLIFEVDHRAVAATRWLALDLRHHRKMNTLSVALLVLICSPEQMSTSKASEQIRVNRIPPA